MKTRLRKLFIRFLFLPLICLFLLVVTAIAILYSQQQRLVFLAVKELNKKLPGELVIGSSTISIFQNFPYVSIALKDVFFYSGKNKRDKPLFEAEKIFTGFSLSDILKQHYRVKVIFLKNGQLHLEQDNDGKINIIEASRIYQDVAVSKKDTTTELDLDLKKIVLKNMDISFFDSKSNQKVISHIDRIQSSFSSDSAVIFSELQGSFIVDYTRPDDSVLFRHRRLESDIKLSYGLSTKLLTIGLCKLKLEDAVFNISGTADLLHDNTVDIKFSGGQTRFQTIVCFCA